MHQRRTGDAARLLVFRQGNVVGDHHQLDVIAHTFCFLSGQTKVQTVAGVVFDDQQTARFAGNRHNRVQHGVHARRSKHFATHRRREHAFADKPHVRRFMTRATA
ncbi:hypothetical protein SRABI106_01421 [Rahnella aquatilis]|nr:hypothetical protein SRABI106_01421 [Rahnella aquatilis]